MSEKTIIKIKTVLLIIMIVLFLAAIKSSAIKRFFMPENLAITSETAKVLPEVDIKGIDCESVVS